MSLEVGLATTSRAITGADNYGYLQANLSHSASYHRRLVLVVS